MKPINLVTGGSPGVSRPARGAWIETSAALATGATSGVAPRAGRVD